MSDDSWVYSSISEASDRAKCEFLQTLHRSPETLKLEVIAMNGNTVFFRYLKAEKAKPKPRKKKRDTIDVEN